MIPSDKIFAHAYQLMEQQHFSSTPVKKITCSFLTIRTYHRTRAERTYYLFATMPHQSLIATMRIASSQKTSSSSSSSSSLKTSGKISSLSSSSRRRRRKTSALFTSASSNDKPAVVILPGLGNATQDYEEFKEELSSRGYVATSIAQVARPDWLRNAAGIVILRARNARASADCRLVFRENQQCHRRGKKRERE